MTDTSSLCAFGPENGKTLQGIQQPLHTLVRATEEQKRQLIEQISTRTNCRNWYGANLKRLLDLEDLEFAERFSTLISVQQSTSSETSEIKEGVTSQILTSTLPEPKFPDWSLRHGCGRILSGVRVPVTIDFNKIIAGVYFHAWQMEGSARPGGNGILVCLVSSYRVNEDELGRGYGVEAGDAINGHYGLKELAWLEENWKNLPTAFQKWAKGKCLYGYRDVARRGANDLLFPCLNCLVEMPCLDWTEITGARWTASLPGLRERVGI